jgi:hypothetical protein
VTAGLDAEGHADASASGLMRALERCLSGRPTRASIVRDGARPKHSSPLSKAHGGEIQKSGLWYTPHRIREQRSEEAQGVPEGAPDETVRR